ncbi:hypothetical protein Tco_0062481 [Tanacetum coccineum]
MHAKIDLAQELEQILTGNPQQEVVNFLAGDSFLGNARSRPLWLLLLQKQNMLLLWASFVDSESNKGKHFSGKVTPLFATMLVQPTQDEGAPSDRPSEAQPTPSPAPTSEVPHELQTDSPPAQTSEVTIEQHFTFET